VAACSNETLAGFFATAPGDVLAERAGAPAEDLVSRREPGHPGPDSLDGARVVHAEPTVLRRAQPALHAHQVRRSRQHVPVERVDRGRVDAHEQLVLGRGRLLELPQLEHVGRPVLLVDERLHVAGEA
jgi:hypothetical protein